ncbi:hypothetical protein K504DRAFT_416231 [Pleomassaria siparia CBS 279.74]|uniref:Uncharacterized protein n=1 Tax=Pleomassaria siparia CBS 279.74 TaxID=1314801 RepID=A0A6G1JUV8_9PLEO|nr:hypothetical protein K504DRAFT_416231 [Pleomassaria siparia CBS 279.74]
MQFTTPLVFLIAAITTQARVLDILPRQAGQAANSQTFTGALGGLAATPVVPSGDEKRPFSVKGDTFVNIGAALQRSCDQQANACANAANAGEVAFSTEDCATQKTACSAAAAA